MKREIGIEHVSHDANSVLTVGTYDGVHRGHRAVLDYVQRRAEERGATSAVISFDPHPRTVVRNEDVPLLTTPEERADLMAAMGVGRFILINFDQNFASMPPREYVRSFLVDTVGLQEIVIGYDHRFGKNRAGDRKLLEELGESMGFEVDVLPAQTVNASQIVSSSEIRNLLTKKGDVDAAHRMLGRYYDITGKVIRGAQRGKQIGFPTANLELTDPRKAVPQNGVYAVKAFLGADEWFPGMMNIGVRPTFGSDERHLEVHILNFDQEIYGEKLRVEFVRRLRDERAFDGIDDLKEQLSRDKQRCKSIFQTSV